jgi:hypothetical protein
MNEDGALTAIYSTRYGSQDLIDPGDEVEIMQQLVAELRTEQRDEPDDEHTQVSISNEHWAVTAQVSGLVIFDNLALLEGEDSALPASVYLRDVPDATLFAIWSATIDEDEEKIMSFGWKDYDKLPEYTRDYYRAT